MFININQMAEVYEVEITAYLADKLIHQQRLQAPKPFIELKFTQLMEQVAYDNRPLKVKLSRNEIIWDNFEQKQKIIPNYIEFKNNHYLKWEDETNGNV